MYEPDEDDLYDDGLIDEGDEELEQDYGFDDDLVNSGGGDVQ